MHTYVAVVCCMHLEVDGDEVFGGEVEFFMTLRSVKQLWQPMSAMALTKDCFCGILRGNLKWL